MVDLSKAFGKSQGFRSRPTGISLSDGGQSFKALADVGSKLSQLSFSFAEELKKEQSLQYTMKATTDYETEVGDSLDKLKMEFGEDTSGYLKASQEAISTTRQKYVDQAPSQQAKLSFDQHAQTLARNANLRAKDYVNSVETTKLFRGMEEDTDKVAHNLTRNPNPDEAYLKYNEQNKVWKNSALLTPEKRLEFEEKTKSKYFNSLLDGYERMNNFSGVKQARRFLNGDNSFATSATPESKRMWQNRIDAMEDKIKVEQELSIGTEIDFTLKGVAGGTVPFNNLENIAKKLNSSALSADKKARGMEKLVTGAIESKISQNIALTPPHLRRPIDETINDIMGDFKVNNPLLGAAIKAESRQAAMTMYGQLEKQLDTDPNKYFTARDPKLAQMAAAAVSGDPQAFQDYKRGLDTYFETFKVPQDKRVYVTDQMKEVFGQNVKGFMAQGNFDKASEVLRQVDVMAGGDKFSVYRDMKLDNFAVLTEAANPQSRERLMLNMDKDAKKRIEGNYKLLDDAEKDTDILKFLQTDPMYSAYIGQSGRKEDRERNANAVLSQVATEYKRLVGEESVDVETAKAQAWSLVSGSYALHNDDNDTVMIPVVKQTGYNQRGQIVTEKRDATEIKEIKDFMQKSKDWDVTMIAELGMSVNSDQGEDLDTLIDDLKDNSSWVTTEDRRGAYLYVDGKPRMRNVGGKKERVRVDFDQMIEKNRKLGKVSKVSQVEAMWRARAKSLNKLAER